MFGLLVKKNRNEGRSKLKTQICHDCDCILGRYGVAEEASQVVNSFPYPIEQYEDAEVKIEKECAPKKFDESTRLHYDNSLYTVTVNGEKVFNCQGKNKPVIKEGVWIEHIHSLAEEIRNAKRRKAENIEEAQRIEREKFLEIRHLYRAALLVLCDTVKNEYADPYSNLFIKGDDIGNYDSVDNIVYVYDKETLVLCASRGKRYDYEADPEGWERDLLNLAERKKKEKRPI